MAIRLTGVAIGVSSAAEHATQRVISTGRTSTPELGRGRNADRDHDQRGRGVADQLPEDRGHDEQAGEQGVRAEAPDGPDQHLGDKVGRAGLEHRRRQRQHRRDEDDGRPGDRAVRPLHRHDPEHDERSRGEEPRHRGRHEAGHEQDDHARQDRDRLPGSKPEGHRLTADELGMVDDEEARVVGACLERLPRPTKQQDVANREFDLLVPEDRAAPLDLRHDEVAALGHHAPEHALADERRARRDHDLEEPALAVEGRALRRRRPAPARTGGRGSARAG